MLKIIASCIIGVLTGYMYGLFFVHERKRVLLNKASTLQTFILPIIMRISLFVALLYYLLITTRMQFILTLLCFVAGFWAMVLQKNIKTSH